MLQALSLLLTQPAAHLQQLEPQLSLARSRWTQESAAVVAQAAEAVAAEAPRASGRWLGQQEHLVAGQPALPG